MCLIFLAVKSHPRYPLVIAGNRDEFYHRPTEVAGYWNDHNQILAGRDLQAGGTWMGITTSGKLSMITNYRDLNNIKADAPSRGDLVADYLKGDIPPQHYMTNIAEQGHHYNGFNLICGTTEALWYYGNYQKGVKFIPPGIHGLSNALLNTSWPKVDSGRAAMEELMNKEEITTDHLFELLRDEQIAPDNLLPDTGVGLERERSLSAKFIKMEGYGSRCSTIIMVDHQGVLTFVERTYDITDFRYNQRNFQLNIAQSDQLV